MHVEVRFSFMSDERVPKGLNYTREEHERGIYCESGGTLNECGCGWYFTPAARQRRLEDLERAFIDAGGTTCNEIMLEALRKLSVDAAIFTRTMPESGGSRAYWAEMRLRLINSNTEVQAVIAAAEGK